VRYYSPEEKEEEDKEKAYKAEQKSRNLAVKMAKWQPCRKYYAINREQAPVVARASDRTTRWIGEAVKIQRKSQGVVNRDEGTAY